MIKRVQPERMGLSRNAIGPRLVPRDGQRDNALGAGIQAIESKVFFEEFPCRFQICRSIAHSHKQIWHERDAERLGDVQEHGLGSDAGRYFLDSAP